MQGRNLVRRLLDWDRRGRPCRSVGAGDNGYGELGFQIRSPLRDSSQGKPFFADTALHLPSCFTLNPISAKLCQKICFSSLFVGFLIYLYPELPLNLSKCRYVTSISALLSCLLHANDSICCFVGNSLNFVFSDYALSLVHPISMLWGVLGCSWGGYCLTGCSGLGQVKGKAHGYGVAISNRLARLQECGVFRNEAAMAKWEHLSSSLLQPFFLLINLRKSHVIVSSHCHPARFSTSCCSALASLICKLHHKQSTWNAGIISTNVRGLGVLKICGFRLAGLYGVRVRPVPPAGSTSSKPIVETSLLHRTLPDELLHEVRPFLF